MTMPELRLRRRCLGATVGLTLAALTTAFGAAQETSLPDPLNIAHRGASAYAPEHTFPAWDLAIEMGADFIEQDLQMTRDGVLVVMHDEQLDRTARGPAEHCSGAVADKTLAQIRRCDVGSWFNEEYPERASDEFVGLRVPMLQEVLQRYPSARFYIETKQPEASPGMEQELRRVLLEHGLARGAGARRVIIQSFSPASLLKFRELNDEIRLVQLVPARESSASIRTRLEQVATYAFGIGPQHEDVDDALMGAARAARLHVHPYTVDATDAMQRLLRLGVDGMFTNRPDRLRALLRTD